MKRLAHAIEIGGVATSLVGAIDSQAVLSWGGALVTLLVMVWSGVRKERVADAETACRISRDAREQARYDELADAVLKAKLKAIREGTTDPFPGWLDMLEPPSNPKERAS